MQFDYPLLKVLSAGLKCNRAVRSLVIVLLLARRPFAVVRRITFVVIYAIKAMVGRRARTNISEEVFKRVPSLAQRYTAFTIAVVGFIGWRVASTANRFPNRVFRTAIGETVRAVDAAYPSVIQASAISAVSTAQVVASNSTPSTAFAVAQPRVGAFFTRSSEITNNKQHSKTPFNQTCLASNGSAKRNLFDILNVNHFGDPPHRVKNLARAATVLQSLSRPVSIFA